MHLHENASRRTAHGNTLFSLRGMSHRYPDGTEALAGIDLDVAAGERIALIGQNGSGKTTLVKHLCGLLRPTAGEVFYKGSPVNGVRPPRDRLEIGLMFQDPDDQLFGHTLMDDVAFGPRNQGLSRTQASASARDALRRVGLAPLAYKAPHNLSYGQKKRAALAGLLAMDPKVLILDEPTANLDPRQEEIFLGLLRNFEGTVICISHDLIFLYELCTRAVVLQHGRVQHDQSLDGLVSRRRSLREYGLDFSFRLTVDARDAEACAPPAQAAAPASGDARVVGSCMVALENYQYRYPDGTRALNGIDLTFNAGDRMAVVGENGAGKSTLLSCLLGVRQGTGTFVFDGRPVTKRSGRVLWRQVGMVFQDCADQLFCPSVEDEIAFGLRRLGLPAGEIGRRVRDALETVRLGDVARRVPLHLSGGERKRLALACVLAMKPGLLILDEPTAGLDPEGEALLLDILRGIEATLLLVSHDVYFVGELTRRVLVMHRGRIVEDLPVGDFLRTERLGHLNGLAFTYRRRCTETIRRLQHLHEHTHPHLHLHEHPHRHGDEAHAHPHAHTHEHPHRFAHSHPGRAGTHAHVSHRLHDHDHPGHDAEAHDHDHGVTGSKPDPADP